MWIALGTGNSFRYTGVHEVANKLDQGTCAAIPVFHTLEWERDVTQSQHLLEWERKRHERHGRLSLKWPRPSPQLMPIQGDVSELSKSLC